MILASKRFIALHGVTFWLYRVFLILNSFSLIYILYNDLLRFRIMETIQSGVLALQASGST